MNKKQAAVVAIIGGVSILIIKLLAYLISNSVALLSDALESIVNIIASIIMLSSVAISERPADDSHPYGHQRVEDISSSLEGLFIIAAALLIAYTAAGRIFEPVELVELNLAILVSIGATTINGVISFILMRTAKESSSMALEGDAKHLLSDVLSTSGVWVGLIIVQITGWLIIDSLIAFGIAAIIIRMGLGLVYHSFQHLMDRACDEEEDMIKRILHEHKSMFIDFHDLRTRRQGSKVLADLHLTMKDSMSVRAAHDIIDHLEQELRVAAPYIELTVHVDPESELDRALIDGNKT